MHHHQSRRQSAGQHILEHGKHLLPLGRPSDVTSKAGQEGPSPCPALVRCPRATNFPDSPPRRPARTRAVDVPRRRELTLALSPRSTGWPRPARRPRVGPAETGAAPAAPLALPPWPASTQRIPLFGGPLGDGGHAGRVEREAASSDASWAGKGTHCLGCSRKCGFGGMRPGLPCCPQHCPASGGERQSPVRSLGGSRAGQQGAEGGSCSAVLELESGPLRLPSSFHSPCASLPPSILKC